MDWLRIAEYIFMSLLSGVSIYIANSIKDMRHSIYSLNEKFAAFTEKAMNIERTLSRYEATLERHSDRLIALEQKTFNYKHSN